MEIQFSAASEKKRLPIKWFYGLCVLLFLLLLIAIFMRRGSGPILPTHLPNFGEIYDTAERKQTFFEFLEPYVNAANQEIAHNRVRLESLLERPPQNRFSKRDALWLHEQAGLYGIDLDPEEPFPADILDRLDLRMGEIPLSLALAQAALESGWGTSRFAQEGNNLFGMWCYTPGCGIVPKKRPSGATYEVKAYRSPQDSFQAYIRNLNSNTAYKVLWNLRARARLEGRPIKGIELAGGLSRYSQEGSAYIEKVRRVIRSNNLE